MSERRCARPHYEGDPTLLRIMLRPQWIAALLLALAVAGGFAWLGKWQLGHAINSEAQSSEQSETPTPLPQLTAPGAPVGDAAAGMMATVTGAMIVGDYSVVEERKNTGRIGAWVVGHFAVEDAGGTPVAHLAVAIGWAPTAAKAERALERIDADSTAGSDPIDITGRYMPSDATVVPEAAEDPERIASMAPAQLINLWAPFDGPVYAGYLVLDPDAAPFTTGELADLGLDPIDSVPPLPIETINWLNLFYAAEWVVFAGFAVFFWYRLTRDAWEKEHELKLLAARADAQTPEPRDE